MPALMDENVKKKKKSIQLIVLMGFTLVLQENSLHFSSNSHSFTSC